MTLIIDAKHLLYGVSMLDQYKGILLSALCVDRWQIMEDYLLTNERNGAKAELYYRQMLAAGRPEPEASFLKCFQKNKNFAVLKPTPCIYYFILV